MRRGRQRNGKKAANGEESCGFVTAFHERRKEPHALPHLNTRLVHLKAGYAGKPVPLIHASCPTMSWLLPSLWCTLQSKRMRHKRLVGIPCGSCLAPSCSFGAHFSAGKKSSTTCEHTLWQLSGSELCRQGLTRRYPWRHRRVGRGGHARTALLFGGEQVTA
eukprot:1143635-Pelagomonas_calceolata.AAC.4